MFGLFKKDPVKKLEKEYDALLEKGMHAQRNGKLEEYGELTKKANELLKEIDKLKANNPE